MTQVAKAIDFTGFKSRKPENNLQPLSDGWHQVAISRVIQLTDRNASLTEPTLKQKAYEWIDETPQLAVIFNGADGGIIHRYNGAGYKRYEEIPENEKNQYVSAAGYAVGIKSKMRVIDEKRTSDAENILLNLFASCKTVDEATSEMSPLPEGSEISDLVGCRLEIFVETHTYEGKAQSRVTKSRRISELVHTNEEF